MSPTYEPGTIAVATVRGVPDVRVFRYTSDRWISDAVLGDGGRLHDDVYVTDVRPLVVLDLDDPDAYGCSAVIHDPAKIVSALRDTNSVAAHAIARQIEAQTKPPRIPEPGLWGVVEATRAILGTSSLTGRWVKTDADSYPWQMADGGVLYTATWVDLIDPVLIRDGIEDGAR